MARLPDGALGQPRRAGRPEPLAAAGAGLNLGATAGEALRAGRRAALRLGVDRLLLASGLGGALSDARAAPGWQTVFATPLQAPFARDPAHDEAALRFGNLTLRQFVPLLLPQPGAPRLRVKLSNEFGSVPLHIGEARLAWRAARRGGDTRPGSDRPLRFGGRDSVHVEPGQSLLSDPVTLPDRPRSLPDADLALSLYLPQAGPGASWHQVGSRSSYRSVPGRHARASRFPAAVVERSLWFLAAVQAAVAQVVPVWVAFGDSITDGAWHSVDADLSWPLRWARDWARRPGRWPLVLNAGLGRNRLLEPLDGPSGAERFERDVLSVSGVQGVVMLIGINDLGGSPAAADLGALVHRLVAGQAALAARARARGLRVVAATLTPVGGSEYFRPEVELARQALNRWIRNTVAFDAVVDFDALLRDPGLPSAMRADWTSDALHPNDAGYHLMAQRLLDTLDRSALAGPLR